MGKESRLRNKKDWEPRGNGRSFFDPDAVPDGCDSDIWHLAVYFKDSAEQRGISVDTGSPVNYEILKKALTNFPPPDIRTRARTCGITVTWVVVVEKSIDYYFDLHDYPRSYIINDYCTLVVFEYYIQYTIDTLERELLLEKGTRIPQQDRNVQPSKRTEEQKIVAKILQEKRSEEEMLEKMREFRRRTD